MSRINPTSSAFSAPRSSSLNVSGAVGNQLMARALDGARQRPASVWEVKQAVNQRLPGIISEITGLAATQAGSFGDLESIVHRHVFVLHGRDHLPAIMEALERVARDRSGGRLGLGDIVSPSGRAAVSVQPLAPLRPLDVPAVAKPSRDWAVEMLRARALGDATLTMIDDFMGDLAPHTGVMLRIGNPDLSERYQAMHTAYRNLEQAVDNPDKHSVSWVLRRISEANEAFLAYAPAGADVEAILRGGAKEVIRTSRDLVLSVGAAVPATPVARPVVAGVVAAGTRVFDAVLSDGEMYDASTIGDAARIGSTYGAVQAEGVTHAIEPWVMRKAEPLIRLIPGLRRVLDHKVYPAPPNQALLGKAPWLKRSIDALPAAQRHEVRTVGDITLQAALHMASDVFFETGGTVAQAVADGRSPQKLVEDGLQAARAARGASLLSTAAVLYLNIRQGLPQEAIAPLAEAIERSGAALAVRMATRDPEAEAASDTLWEVRPGAINAFALLALEHHYQLGIDPQAPLRPSPAYSDAVGAVVPGLAMLRRLQSAAARSDAAHDAGPRALPSSGTLRHMDDVVEALAVLAQREGEPQSAARLLLDLLSLDAQPDALSDDR